ncbi:MAG: TIGR00266 family protein [Candidatus Odinarchaeum yellowstonii]|uniref:TIGR00266 family protein n=1 Tax=Odinarchaeota yellowstonii (strain LCB_4) TaxID=1841599 RepID=A0AAF0D1Y6_ODILC|nr:MAG: TIGR00266 family protein [Candidatus Odinarchaeum yellowstonii]
MDYEIKYSPSYSMLVVKLKPGESITAEAGAMTYMTPNLEIKTRKREEGILKSLKVAILGQQSFFVNDYIARDGTGEIGLVSAPLGDIVKLDVNSKNGYIVQQSAYIASTPGVTLDTQWQGFVKGIFGQSLFMVKIEGEGQVFLNSFGALDKHTLKPGETIIVDNYHLVAFTNTCEYTVKKFGGLKSTILGGEGLVTEIKGPGDVYIQTKNLREFVEWLWTLIGPRISRAR